MNTAPSTGCTTSGKLNMSISERRDIYTGLEETLGEQVARMAKLRIGFCLMPTDRYVVDS